MVICLIILLGLIMGSFASCASYRLSYHEDLALTRSKCVRCGNSLKIRNLIPLFSYIFQRGKCSFCHEKISLFYPLVEIFFVLTFLAIYFLMPQNKNPLFLAINLNFILICLIATNLIIISLVDIEKYFIPNSAQIILFCLSLLYIAYNYDANILFHNFLAGLLYTGFGLGLYFLFYITARARAIGIDDIKFLFIAGFLLGINKFLLFILLSGFIGLIFGSIWIRLKKDETFPFAPALCLATLISLLTKENFNLVDIAGSLLFF